MTDEPKVDVLDLLRGIDLEAFDPADFDGAVIVDAFIVFRYQRPEWMTPRPCYTGSSNTTDEDRIGILTMVLDRIRDVAKRGWVDDE